MFDFIRKINWFCGGKFLKRSPCKLISYFLEGPLEAYIFILWFWKAPFCPEAPCGAFVPKKYDFWKIWACPESKSMHFLKFGHFVKNGSPGQTTMLTRRAAKFCVEPRSPFSKISHHNPKTIWKAPNIVSWPECQPNPIVDDQVSRFEPRFEPWARFDYDSDGSVRYADPTT